MSKQKQCFKENKEMVYYLTKKNWIKTVIAIILILKICNFLNVTKIWVLKNLEEENHRTDTEIYASDDEITENNRDKIFIQEKIKSQNGKRVNRKNFWNQEQKYYKENARTTTYAKRTASEIDLIDWSEHDCWNNWLH